jgi:hypothetical protein
MAGATAPAIGLSCVEKAAVIAPATGKNAAIQLV